VIENRIIQLREHCHVSNIDAAVITALPSLRYLTGFSGSSGACIITKDKKYFITDFRYQEQINQEISGFEILIDSSPPLQYFLDQNILSANMRIGFENKRISYLDYERLVNIFQEKNLVPLEDRISLLQSQKDGDELRLLKKAASITDEVFQYILTILRPGLTEIEISAELSYQVKKHGGEKDAFDFIVASGPRASLPHGFPGNKVLENGELVIMDFGAVYKGYHADITRTVMMGEPSRKQREVYNTVYEAQTSAIDMAKAGVIASELDKTARGIIEKRGFGEYFGHGLGHGVGLEIHESPRISPKNNDALAVGNVVTIEPGIYLPGFCGVRIEDDVVINENSCSLLTHSPKDLITIET